MLSIVLFVLEMISKMCGIETSPIPEIVHDLGLSDTGHPQIPWFFIILAIFGDTPFFWVIPCFQTLSNITWL